MSLVLYEFSLGRTPHTKIFAVPPIVMRIDCATFKIASATTVGGHDPTLLLPICTTIVGECDGIFPRLARYSVFSHLSPPMPRFSQPWKNLPQINWCLDNNRAEILSPIIQGACLFSLANFDSMLNFWSHVVFGSLRFRCSSLPRSTKTLCISLASKFYVRHM